MTAYKVRLDPARCCARRSPIPRGSIDAFCIAGQRVVLSFAPDACVLLEPMSARRIFTARSRLAAIAPYLWMALFFLVPFGFVLKISLSQTAIAQPPYRRCSIRRRAGRRSSGARRAVARQFQDCWRRTISTSAPICAASSSP